jgi:hypothetical protein
MPQIHMGLWKILGRENWEVITILSKMGCQPELS